MVVKVMQGSPSAVRFLLLAAGVAGVWGCRSHAPVAAPDAGARITHGVAAGEVTSTSAVIWGRCSAASRLQLTLRDAAGDREIQASAAASAADDFTAKVPIGGLQPDTTYTYRVTCRADTAAAADGVARGTFRTAPPANASQPVTFVWGGDVGGQNACRDRTEGYGVFRTIGALRPAFFIGLGDMIYADSPCLPTGRYGNTQVPGPVAPAADVPSFWARWKYNRADRATQELLATLPYYAVWDDHEVYSDFGPHHDVGPTPRYPPGRHLLPLGRKAFLDYNPIAAGGDAPRLYRNIRWGRHLDLFILDTRQYRDSNFAPDRPTRPKTMLGATQRAWLEQALAASDATWKVIVSSVPLSVPTGAEARGRDGWANGDQESGFEHELLDILRFMQQRGIYNNIWIATDIHFAAVFRDAPFADDPDFRVVEVDTGPMNAGVFPRPEEVDPTLHPQRLFTYPSSAEAIGGFEQAKSWFNFGVMRIDADGRVTVQIVNALGTTLYELPLSPHPR